MISPLCNFLLQRIKIKKEKSPRQKTKRHNKHISCYSFLGRASAFPLPTVFRYECKNYYSTLSIRCQGLFSIFLFFNSPTGFQSSAWRSLARPPRRGGGFLIHPPMFQFIAWPQSQRRPLRAVGSFVNEAAVQPLGGLVCVWGFSGLR